MNRKFVERVFFLKKNSFTITGTRRQLTYSNVFQTSGRVGENCRLAVRDCRCAHNRTARARHRVQLQLLLSQRDWPRRHAIAKLQPRHQLPLSSRYFRWVSTYRCHSSYTRLTLFCHQLLQTKYVPKTSIDFFCKARRSEFYRKSPEHTVNETLVYFYVYLLTR